MSLRLRADVSAPISLPRSGAAALAGCARHGAGPRARRVQSSDGGCVVTAWILAIGRMLGLGSIAGIRPSLTLAVIGVVGYFDWGVETNSTFSWLSHWLAIGIFVVLAILESTFDKISKLDRLQDRLIMPYRLFMGGVAGAATIPFGWKGDRGRGGGRRRRRLVRAVHQAPQQAQERAEPGRGDAHQHGRGARGVLRQRARARRAVLRLRVRRRRPGSSTGACAAGAGPSTGRCAARRPLRGRGARRTGSRRGPARDAAAGPGATALEAGASRPHAARRAGAGAQGRNDGGGADE